MNKPHICVRIQAHEYPSSDDREVKIELHEPLVRETFKVLDYPKPDCGIAAMFCTDTMTIQHVKEKRQFTAEFLSKVLADAILKAMGQKDTRMGYPINSAEPPASH
jgi:hypothetical protein